MVLQEHEWNVEDALQVLRMFSDAGADSASSLNLILFASWFFLYFLFVCIQ